MSETPIPLLALLGISKKQLSDLAGLSRLNRLFQDADLARTLEILLADPQRFLRKCCPGLVRCVGRHINGTLCDRWFYTSDVSSKRRCPDCHRAEELAEIEACRLDLWYEGYATDSEEFEREPTPDELAELEPQDQNAMADTSPNVRKESRP